MLPRKVIHVVKSKGVGGCERHLLTLLPLLRERGVDAKLAVLAEPASPPDDLVAAFRVAGVPVSTVPIRTDYDVRTTAILTRSFRSHRPDLVHTHLIHADLHGAVAARLAGVPGVVGSRHNLLTERTGRPAVEALAGLAARRLCRVIAISDAVAEAVTRAERVPSERIHRIYYGIPVPAEASPRPRGVVGTATRLIPGKDLETLLRAWALVEPREGERLLIAGDGPDAEPLRTLAGRLGLDGRVEFLGFLPDVTKLHRDISIFVQTSLSEGLGLAAVEAAAAGLPVVASRVGALPEVVRDGETGLLAPPAEPEPLAQALDRLLREPSAAERMGEAARKDAAMRFGPDRMVEETLAVYSACA